MRILLSLLWAVVFCAFALPAAAIETRAKQMILVDDATGTVLAEQNADEKMHPSSMSKLMTIYVTFKRLKEGTLKLTDEFPVSEAAWSKQGSKMFVPINAYITVEDLLRGIIIQSGNDACIVIAEGLAGSEAAFAEQLNEEAKAMGLTNSHFLNATGWPDEGHLMTARDLSILAHHLIHDFPEYYHYFAEENFTFNGIKQGNRNLLLYNNIGVDGLKTGHSEIAGYGITITGQRDGRRLILVVNGLKDAKERASEAELLLNYGFRNFDNVKVVSKGDTIDKADVWFGKAPSVNLVSGEDVVLTLPRTDRDAIKLVLTYMSPLPAPVKQGDHVADLVVSFPGGSPRTIPLLAGESVDKLSGMARLLPMLDHKLFGR